MKLKKILISGLTALSSQDEDVGQFEVQDALEESTISLVSSSTSAYSSFPVDVVVYIRVQVRIYIFPVTFYACIEYWKDQDFLFLIVFNKVALIMLP